jgi:peptide-methionine (S)-S-oxide reductase
MRHLRTALVASIAVVLGGLATVHALSRPMAPSGGALVRLSAPAGEAPAPRGASSETVVLSGGCFWGVQGVFQHVRGVRSAVSGYAGGAAATADYDLVSTGTTGHAESVKITFDPSVVSFGQILQVFFSVATDPTQLNQQFPDQGPQYRSEVFFTTPAQAALAHAYIAQLDRTHAFARPIVTRVDPLRGFYPAEAYHQDYLTLHPDRTYIATYDLPKVAALKSLFPEAYTVKPTLVTATGQPPV